MIERATERKREGVGKKKIARWRKGKREINDGEKVSPAGEGWKRRVRIERHRVRGVA